MDYRLIVTILLVSLSRNIFASSLKRPQCIPMVAEKALKKHTEPCHGRHVSNHDVERLPQVISEIVCPDEAGDRCIQLVLPMVVTSISNDVDKSEQNIIYVRSGCIDTHDVKKSNTRKSKSGGRESRKSNRVSRRSRYSRSR